MSSNVLAWFRAIFPFQRNPASIPVQAAGTCQWADLVTVHGVSGPGVLDAVAKAALLAGREVGILIVAQMSCADNLAKGEYTEKCLEMAKKDVVSGLISQSRLTNDEVRDVKWISGSKRQ